MERYIYLQRYMKGFDDVKIILSRCVTRDISEALVGRARCRLSIL